MTSVIDRPDIGYDDDAHAYTIDGEPVPGCSTIAKVYDDDGFGRGAWWGWGIAAEGVIEIGEYLLGQGYTLDELRGELRRRKFDPVARRDAGGKRGTAVHDALEALALRNEVPDPSDYPPEQRGHVRSLVRWYLEYRPEFEAVEVMVGSRAHRYAGRYDIRANIPGIGLALVDLKTSKGVYPTSHFVQLEGYELASVEMGFAATAGRWVLRTSEDGSFVPHWQRPSHKWDETNFVESWAEPEQFLACLDLYRQMEDLKTGDPAAHWKDEVEKWLLAAVEKDPWKSRDLAATPRGMGFEVTGRDVGFAFGRLRKQGLVKQLVDKTWVKA